MRLLIFILLFPFFASSQVIMTARYTAKASSASCSYLLDSYSGAAAAYSLRKLSSSYSGYAIKVRRSSDNTEQDIGFTNCDLDTASMKTFVGSNSAYVVTWYNQGSEGSSDDVTQATSTAQPRIMNSGVIERNGGKPYIYFDGSDDKLQVASFMGGTYSSTAYLVLKNVEYPSSADSRAGFPIFAERDAGSAASLYVYSNSHIYDGFNSLNRPDIGAPTSVIQSPHLYTTISGANDKRAYVNNSSLYTSGSNSQQSPSSGTPKFVIGKQGTEAYAYYGHIGEVVIYKSVSSDGNRNGISSNINTYYTLY